MNFESVIKRIIEREEVIKAELLGRLEDSFFPVLGLIGVQIREKMAVAFKCELRDCSEARTNLLLDIAILAALAIVELEAMHKLGEKPPIPPLTSLN